MSEDSKKLSDKTAWWKPGLEIFSIVSSWIVAPIVVALVAGKALDRHFGTEPLIFLILAGVGFLVTAYGIYREVVKYMKKMEDLSKKDGK